MNTTTRTVLIIAVVIVVGSLLLFGSGTMTGWMGNGGMMGNGMVGGVSWMWIPGIVAIGLVVLLVWGLAGKKG